MSVIAVAGGTGTAGRAIAAEAIRRGFETRILSRHAPEAGGAPSGVRHFPADLATGDGLAAALAGADIVVDATDGKSGRALQAMPQNSSNLLRAAQLAGADRAVLLSIAGADQSTLGYYKVQAARARRFNAAPMDTVIAYSTQFHDLLASLFAAGARIGLIPALGTARFQPIATAAMAAALLDAALKTSEEPHGSVSFGGPEVLPMKELARQWQAITGRRGLLVSVPVPGPVGRYLAAGTNLVPGNALPGQTFREWLLARG
ncbi:MAG: SDR family oxidoreductase [Actinomycetales bacterium]